MYIYIYIYILGQERNTRRGGRRDQGGAAVGSWRGLSSCQCQCCVSLCRKAKEAGEQAQKYAVFSCVHV